MSRYPLAKEPLMDKAVAGAVLVLGAPLLGARALVAYRQTGRVLHTRTVVGHDGRTFTLCSFAGEAIGARLPQLVHVVRGQLRFVGPAPRPPAPWVYRPHDRTSFASAVAPGIFCSDRLRSYTGIAYERAAPAPTRRRGPLPDRPEARPVSVDGPLDSPDGREPEPTSWQPEDQSLLRPANVALIARSVLARALGGHGVDGEAPDMFELLGVDITNASMDQALAWIARAASAPHGGAMGAAVGDRRAIDGGPSARMVCFVNPSCLNTAVEDADYLAVLQDADLVLADGIGVRMAARLRGIALRDNVNGTDLFPRLCRRARRLDLPLFLLGARDGVAREAAQEMIRQVPGLRIAGTHHGYIADDPALEAGVIAEINASGARMLLVGMGAPHQERWLARHRHRLKVPVVIGVGGLFDFYSGRIPRAPLWVREIGMEWVWRLAQEPRRMWRRYVIGNPLFLWRVWRDVRVTESSAPQGASRDHAVA